jgi:hypothetical protein
LGLTVSKHQVGQQPDDRTNVRKVSDYLYGVVPGLASQLKNLEYSDIPLTVDWFKDLGYEDIPGTTAYLEKLAGTDKIAPFIKEEILTTDPKTKLGENFPHLSLSDAASAIAQLQSGLVGHGGLSDTGVSTKDVHDTRLNIANPYVPFGEEISPEIIAANIKQQRDEAALTAAGDAIAESELQATTGVDTPTGPEEPVRPGDPLVDPDANPYLGVLPDLPQEVDYSALKDSQQAYLDALQNKNYDRDKYLALANFGLNLMSEAPQYEGEGFLSIAGRAGKEPLAQITKISEAERDAGLGFLKAKMDIEGIRANLKTKGEQTRFDNIIAKALAGAKLTAAEAAYIKAKYGDFKAISLTTGDLKIGPDRLRKITDALGGKNLGELTKVMNDAGWKLDSGNPLTTSNVEQILKEITQGGPESENSEAFISVITRSKEIYEGSEGRISQADSDRQAVREFLLGGGEFDKPFWSTIFPGTSTAGAARSSTI